MTLWPEQSTTRMIRDLKRFWTTLVLRPLTVVALLAIGFATAYSQSYGPCMQTARATPANGITARRPQQWPPTRNIQSNRQIRLGWSVPVADSKVAAAATPESAEEETSAPATSPDTADEANQSSNDSDRSF